jgi:hypothetical protein
MNDLDGIKNMLNKINSNDVSDMLNKFGMGGQVENDNVIDIIENLKNIDVNKDIDKLKLSKISDVVDEFIHIFNKSKINNTNDIIKITTPLVDKYKNLNLSQDEIIIGVFKNKDKISKIDMNKMMNLVMKMSTCGGDNSLNLLSLMSSMNN